MRQTMLKDRNLAENNTKLNNANGIGSRNLKNNAQGITLIALVITIIVLLILAGVSISAITGNDSAMQKAQTAKNESEKGDELDFIKLAVVDAVAHSDDGWVTLPNLQNAVKDLDGVSATEGAEAGTFNVIGKKASYIVSRDGQVNKGSDIVIASTISIEEGKTGTLTVRLYGDLVGQQVTWEAIDGAKFDDGTTSATGTSVTVKALGGKITATAGGQTSNECQVIVAILPKVGDYITLTANQFEDNTNVATNLSNYTSDKVQGLGGTNITTLTRDTANDKYLKWRVLEVDSTTGQPTQIISEDVLNNNIIQLSGANGYNNAVYLLNGLCGALYTTSLGTTRSTKIEDLEKHFSDSANNNKKESYTNTNVTPNLKVGDLMAEPYETNTQYPAIAGQEAGIYLNGSETQVGTLNQSEQSEVLNNGKITTATKLKITQTRYGGGLNSSAYTSSLYFYIFHPSASYWVASRCIEAYSDYCSFEIFSASRNSVSTGSIGGKGMFVSNGSSGSSHYLGLRPIITLNSNVKATYSAPYDTTYNTFTLK